MSVRWVTQKNGSGVEVRFVMVDVTYRYPDGRTERVRKATEIQNLRAAKQEEATILAALAAGTYSRERKPAPVHLDTTAPTLAEFSVTFLDTYARVNNKPSEVESKESILENHLLPQLGKLPLDAITVEAVERYKASRIAVGCGPKTVNNQLAVLRRMLTLAVEWKRIPSAPKVREMKVPDADFRFLSFDETDRLIASAGEWAPMIGVTVRTGMRIGETLALRWCDVDLTTERITVRRAVARGKIGTPKGGRPRTIDLSDQAVSLLRSVKHLRRGEDLVFHGPAGRMLTRGEVKWPLWSSCDRANIERIGWHVLRHTFASHLAMLGESLKVIQELLGHSEMTETMRYAHLCPSVKRSAVKSLDGKQEANGGTPLRADNARK
jgi:integrase